MIKFGTDGWRAIIAKDFTFENVQIVTQAVAEYLSKTKTGPKKIVIGYDSRFLSKEFAETAGLVLAANGIKAVVSEAAVPTPVVSFHCRYGKYDLGIMITASHNPAEFNGFKIKTPQGGSADKSLTDEIERLLSKTKPKLIEGSAARAKGLLVTADLSKSYMDFFKKFIDLHKVRSLRARVLVDVMYGSGDHFVEKIVGKGSLTFDYLHADFNPSFGGIHPEPIEEYLTEMRARMKKGGYDVGLVLDGDADRIAMFDSKGNYINAQTILPLLAIHLIRNRRFSGGIGKTVVGSDVIDKVALALNVPCYETAIGFKYLSRLFGENLIAIGGEEAGGIGFKGYIPERDGSMAFLLMLEMMATEGKNFDELLFDFRSQFGRYYYDRTKLPVKTLTGSLSDMKLPRDLFGKKIERVNTIDGIKLITKDYWLMFRKSGTEPIVRVYAEGRNKKIVARLVALGTRMIHDL